MVCSVQLVAPSSQLAALMRSMPNSFWYIYHSGSKSMLEVEEEEEENLKAMSRQGTHRSRKRRREIHRRSKLRQLAI